MIIINAKNYLQGQKLLDLAKKIQSYDLHALLAVPTADIKLMTSKSELQVYAQHIDYVENVKSTGFVSAFDVKAEGASGTLLNHSEHPLALEILKKTIEQCRLASLVTIVCAKNLEQAKQIAKLKPHAIAFEDPELISSGKSITQYKAKDVKKFADLLKKTSILPICGAGISSIEDVKAAYNLGCKGVLIASAITAAKNPDVFLKALGEFDLF